jgi:hypothetical protein
MVKICIDTVPAPNMIDALHVRRQALDWCAARLGWEGWRFVGPLMVLDQWTTSFHFEKSEDADAFKAFQNLA